ncbi:HNH endonuclease [Brucella intermedia]|uniref:HNH endonuclease n=1 Tax=Brucella intermedia TaxID=94625 RepID=UPI00244B66F6|nr:HNH endonuclease [Brucella intermedia]WGG61875.1 HNH endonuclease [Brucella intermedia]
MADFRLCSISDCGKAAKSRGLCANHYFRLRKYGDPLMPNQRKPKNYSTCSVAGCLNLTRTKGLCLAHYKKLLKYGDPNINKTARQGELRKWVEDNVNYSGEDCLRWPFHYGPTGYGSVSIDGQKEYAHRYMCSIVNGPAPSNIYEAAHSCGNGHLGCLNPTHLRWATRSENIEDKIEHGTSQHGENNAKAKLTEADVRTIRRMLPSHSNKEIAELYGVTNSAIWHIRIGSTWSWLP